MGATVRFVARKVDSDYSRAVLTSDLSFSLLSWELLVYSTNTSDSIIRLYCPHPVLNAKVVSPIFSLTLRSEVHSNLITSSVAARVS
jgi:hypothetical protein